MILSNFHEAGVDTIDWLKTFKQAYHINLRFDPIGKLKQLLIKEHKWRATQILDQPNHITNMYL